MTNQHHNPRLGRQQPSWSAAQEARLQAQWSEIEIPSPQELLHMHGLFDAAPPHRMHPGHLGRLRERVFRGRVRCTHPCIDAFIDDVLSDDLTLESYFVVQDARTLRLAHPLSRSYRLVTPFQLVTNIAWELSIADGVRKEEGAVMHAAGLFYLCGHAWALHPQQAAGRNGARDISLDEIRRRRWQVLHAPLEQLCTRLPGEGALLTALLLGWASAEHARTAASQGADAEPQQQYARLQTLLHLNCARLGRLWSRHIRWS